MANQVITNKMAMLMSLKMAALAGFLKKGAKNYFQDQMAGKRCGQTYDFVLRDAGNVVEGLVASPRDIVEKKVSLTIKNYNNSVSTDALEGVTDITWQDEIAETYAKKLMQLKIPSLRQLLASLVKASLLWQTLVHICRALQMKTFTASSIHKLKLL
jgi:hypothetical protein